MGQRIGIQAIPARPACHPDETASALSRFQLWRLSDADVLTHFGQIIKAKNIFNEMELTMFWPFWSDY
jgi:hypothetical protein